MILKLQLSERDSLNLERIANALSKMAEIPTIHKDYKVDETIGMVEPSFSLDEKSEQEEVWETAAKYLEENDNNDFFEEDSLPIEVVEKM